MKTFILSILAAILSIFGINMKPATKTTDLRLGTTDLVVTVPKSLEQDSVTKEEADDFMINYFVSDKDNLDFDVYQWAVACDRSFNDEIEEAVSAVKGGDLERISYNNVDVATWTSIQYFDYDKDSVAEEYKVISAMAEDGNGFYVELEFWTETSEEEAAAWNVIKSIKIDKKADVKGNVAVGNTSLSMNTKKTVDKIDLTAEEVDEFATAHYEVDDVTIYVYQQGKASDFTLKFYAANERAEYYDGESEVKVSYIYLNRYYTFTTEEEGTYYTVYVTSVDGQYVMIEFSYENVAAADTVKGLIKTIK